MDQFSGYYDQIASMNAANNAWSAEQAQKQMDFQERMSSTAHQREVADLQAAGLNPILSARAAGASSPSGAMGQTDTSGPSAMVSLLGHLVQSMTALENARVSAQASLAVADKYNATSQLLEQMRQSFEIEHPSNMWRVISSVLDGAGLSSGKGIFGVTSNLVDFGREVAPSFPGVGQSLRIKTQDLLQILNRGIGSWLTTGHWYYPHSHSGSSARSR